MSDYPITSTSGKRMLSYLPGYYETSRIMRALVQTRGVEVDKAAQALNEILDQAFVTKSTWSMEDWEGELGLKPIPGMNDAERIDRIVSHIRGYGTCDFYLIKKVSEAYDKGAVDPIQNHTLYQITIRFVDTTGVPPNIEDLKKAVREVIPAHLEVVYEYNYLIWAELDGLSLIWTDLDDLRLTWDELEVFKLETHIIRSSIGLTMCEQ